MSAESVKPVVCRTWSPIPCPGRKMARDLGEFSYVWGLGWVWWRSRDVVTPWTECPWCGHELPTMEGLVLRALRRDDA